MKGILDDSGDWNTSTPVQCRHDSGFESFPEECGFSQELSPIRKHPSLYSDKSSTDAVLKNRNVGKLEEINPRKLDFSILSNVNNQVNLQSDSGIELSISESTTERQDVSGEEARFVTDENSNITCIIDSADKNKSWQPLKYICRDHSLENKPLPDKSNTVDKASETFISCAITKEFIELREENKRLDILQELNLRNCTSIISDILSHLSGEDLRQTSNVCKEWQVIVSNDKNASYRRIVYLNNKKNAAHGPDKENKSKTTASVQRDHKSAFTCIANIGNETKQPLIFDNFLGKFDSFIQAQKLNAQQVLMKCPKCCYAARASTGYKYSCVRNLCKYEFCEKCLGPYLDNHMCSVPEFDNTLPNIIINSKKSRKNLRRLRA